MLMFQTTNMKRWTVTIVAAMVLVLNAVAQPPRPGRPFDPAKFEADLEQFITTRAGLSVQEAAAFFPEYRKMMKAQRVLFNQMRRYRHVDNSDNRACEEAIRKQDELDLQIKRIQQGYHQKFMTILPASKVFMVIRAEEKFHRQAFRRAAKRGE